MIPEWLEHPLTLEEAEARELVDGIPFGCVNGEWRELQAKLKSGRELWYFRSPPETWTGFPLSGMEGYAVVEDEEIVAFMLTAIS